MSKTMTVKTTTTTTTATTTTTTATTTTATTMINSAYIQLYTGPTPQLRNVVPTLNGRAGNTKKNLRKF